jgi:hypothetical protein
MVRFKAPSVMIPGLTSPLAMIAKTLGGTRAEDLTYLMQGWVPLLQHAKITH